MANTFNRKSYWAIYVDTKENIARVKEIIKIVDEYEYDYIPSDLIKPMSDFWQVWYTWKFDDIDMGIIEKLCFNEGIHILCYNNWLCDWGFDKEKYNIKYYLDKNTTTK